METAPAAGSGADGSNKTTLTVLVLFEMKTTLRSHDVWKSGIRRKDAARR